MTTAEVTAKLLHHLVTGSHAEGITELAVEAAIGHEDNDGQILLVADPGKDFADDSWQLPAGLVLPGQTLTDALPPAVAAIGLSIQDVTGYLGHHDRPGDQATMRVFRFAVTVTDPGAICRHAGTGHHWAFSEDLNCPAADTASVPSKAATMPAGAEPPLAGPLRAWARGIYPDEAAVELLISHATFLRRVDFTSRFISTHASGDGTVLAAIDWTAAITALDDQPALLRRRTAHAPAGSQPRRRHTRQPPRRPHRHRLPRHPARHASRPARSRAPGLTGIS